VFVKTVDGVTQTSAILPSAQGAFVDLLIKNDVPFQASGGANGGNQAAGGLGNLVGLILPLALLALFIGPRLGGGSGGGGPRGGGGGGFGGGMNPFEMVRRFS
jgi:hypothetical protein